MNGTLAEFKDFLSNQRYGVNYSLLTPTQKRVVDSEADLYITMLDN
jgi:hypothetical protein